MQKLNEANDTNHCFVTELLTSGINMYVKNRRGFSYCFCYVCAQNFLSALFTLGALESILLIVNLVVGLHLLDITNPANPAIPNGLPMNQFDS